ncbi:hypothetical protein FSPOR_8844 [Fusarium sporotrichioides]|uniref:Uncharacterized protein n=1 Tax=Fusarium sporotrichioides TaxID=5514 RepID=A0A395RSP2_FUSSP|nr:hypothetical protein FSPOR_8844 [Fusarium sporotrichioides]
MGFTIRGLASAALVSCYFHLTSALVVQPQAPEPTLPARIQHLEHIYERDEGVTTETLNVVVGANNTCGYGPRGVTCFSTYSCLYETEKYNAVFCNSEGLRTSCLGNAEALNTKECDEQCRKNFNIRKCTSSSQTECFTIYYPNDLTGFICDSKSGYATGKLFPGFEDLSVSTLEVNVFPAATLASHTEALSTEASRTETSDEATSTRPTVTVTNEPQEEGQEEGGGGSKNNAGAIAGGVVGGVVGLAALGLAMFFIRRRNNKKKEQQRPTEMAGHGSLQPQIPPYGMTPEQQQQQQRWSTVSQSPPAWKPTDVAPSQSPQILVEAPNESAAQVHEMDGSGAERSGGK